MNLSPLVFGQDLTLHAHRDSPYSMMLIASNWSRQQAMSLDWGKSGALHETGATSAEIETLSMSGPFHRPRMLETGAVIYRNPDSR
jgi:hypothetical protein